MPTDPTFDEVSPEVAALFAAARATTPATPDPSLTSLMAASVDTGSLTQPLDTPRRKTLLGKLITAKALAVAGALVLTGGVAAAATGTLPDPVQDTASNVADVVGVNIPKSNHGSEVSPVARDKSGDDSGNHGATVSDTARDNHGHNKDDDTTSTSTTVVGGSKHDDGPGNSGHGNANGHSKHDGTDDDADDSTTSTTVVNGTTSTTVDDHGGGKNSGSGKGKGGSDKSDDSASHKSSDDD